MAATHRLRAHHQAPDVKAHDGVRRCVGTPRCAQRALVTGLNQLVLLVRGHHRSIMGLQLINQRKGSWKDRAQIHTQPTVMTHIQRPCDLKSNIGLIEIQRIIWVIPCAHEAKNTRFTMVTVATHQQKVGTDADTPTKMGTGTCDFARGYRLVHRWTSSVREAVRARHNEALLEAEECAL